MRSSLQLVLYMLDVIKRVTLHPIIPGSLLAVLAYGPVQLRDPLLGTLTKKLIINPRRLKFFLKILLALGVVRMVNRTLNAIAANNWRLSLSKPWIWSTEIAVVTGGLGGIGRIIVEDLANRDVTVVVLDVQALPGELKENQRVKYFPCDLTSTESVTEVADTIRRTIGHPSILVNNAGISDSHGILGTSDDYLRRIMGVNLLSHWTTTREFLPNMIRQNKGHIVTMASMGSFVTVATSSDYSATKAGTLAFHEGLGSELRHVYKAPGVITTVVHPNYVRTPMTGNESYRFVRQQGNMLGAEEVGKKVVKQIMSRQGGQLIIPDHLSISPVLRAWPTWLQDLIRDLVSRPVIAGV